MLIDKDLSTEGEPTHTHITDPSNPQKNDNEADKIEFNEKGIDFLRETDKSCDQFETKPPKLGNSELTLSYLCENSKLGLPDEEIGGKNILNSFDKVSSYKGKERVSQNEDVGGDRWVERDFLQLNELNENSSKRGVENDEIENDIMEKKPKIETLNLSLSLPDVSFSLAASVPAPTSNIPIAEKPSWYAQAPSNNNTRMTQSNDLSFTAASMSYSYSHPFSHNPSCSLTRNSTDFEYSMGSHRRDCDQIWNAGEGTNGSVHSRFRPIGDGSVALSNHGSSVFSFMQNRGVNRDNNNSLHNGTSSDNLSFFPTELPPRPRMDAQSGDSRGRGLENVRESLDGLRARKLSRPERIIKEIVSESLPVMSQIVQELTEVTIELIKEHLKTLISSPERRHELMSLQNRLAGRSDLTKETLSKCPKTQLEIFVSIKVGLVSFLSNNVRVSVTELVEIYLLERCRNLICKRPLPVEDCECKICSTKKGYCSECMCPVCFKFDCANNTCSWVGCDVCSHWCHAACGIQKNLIKPNSKAKGPAGTTEVHFHCLGCDHASEMFGFVKDVFMSCATDWDLETLVKELECVRKIFKESEGFKGSKLRTKAEEMIIKLESKMISPLDACNFIFQFFKYVDGMLDFPSSSAPPKDLPPITQNTLRNDVSPHLTATTLPPKPSFYNQTSNNRILELNPNNFHQSNNNLNASLMAMADKNIEDEWSVKAPTKKDKDNGFDSLESIVRIKEVEARMFQSRADEARREAENYRRMVQMKSEKLDEEYGERIAKLCLEETEERKRKKVEEMKVLENSHCDYYKMKLRMQAEITGLLERMEATKQQLV